MKFDYSDHWLKKRKYRPNITEDLFEYAIQNSDELKDKHWPDASNAICRIPPHGRIIKVVYKRTGRTYKIITAFWLD